MRLNKIQKTAVNALDDIKARDIIVLDVRKLTSLFDAMIIASAESNRQVKALARHVCDKLTAIGATIVGVEGEETGEWVLVDAGRHRRPHHAARRARALQPGRALGSAFDEAPHQGGRPGRRLKRSARESSLPAAAIAFPPRPR